MKMAWGRALAGAAGATLLHIVLGWAWTVVAAVGVGFWQGRGGWKVGAGSVGLSFVLLIAYNFAVAPGPVMRMGKIMGEIMGGAPSPVFILVSALMGALIGAIGGGLGAALRHITG